MKTLGIKNQDSFSLILALLCIFLLSGIFGKTVLNVLAEEQNPIQKYYTDITVREGDSLWSIAQTYCYDGEITVEEYIREIARINQLNTETIHTGQKLLIIYYVHGK